MNWGEAVRVSHRLVEAGYSHSLHIGVHDQHSPRVHCRLELDHPPGKLRSWEWADLEAVQSLLAEEGCDLTISSLDLKLYAKGPEPKGPNVEAA